MPTSSSPAQGLTMTVGSLNVSVVICAYTEARWDDLLASVQSVRNQVAPPGEIILVIDHNPSLLRRAYSHIEGVRVVENGERRGLAGARNSGIRAARGEVIAFLDEDARAAHDWLAALLPLYRDPHVVGVGGGIEAVWDSGRPGWFPREFDWVVGCTYRGMPQSRAAVRNLIGCNMSFRRELFERVGGFRNGMGRVGTYPVGCEETEFCIRVRQAHPGGLLLYEPKSVVYHRVPATRGQWTYFGARCFAEGLSKAEVTHHVGVEDGLQSERAYTVRTLPRGVGRGLADGLMRRDPAGFGRAGAIVAGLLLTASGYVAGRVAASRPRFRLKPDGDTLPPDGETEPRSGVAPREHVPISGSTGHDADDARSHWETR